MFFGFFTQGLSDRLSSVHLETLRPYLKQLDIHTIMDMAEFCVSYEYREWAHRYLHPEFNRRRAELEPQSKDRDFIESMARHHFPTDTDLLKELDWIEQQQHPEGHIRYIGRNPSGGSNKMRGQAMSSDSAGSLPDSGLYLQYS
jgi:hypothetical protein